MRAGVQNLWYQPLDGCLAWQITHFPASDIFDFSRRKTANSWPSSVGERAWTLSGSVILVRWSAGSSWLD
jgi:hypothetical protein